MCIFFVSNIISAQTTNLMQSTTVHQAGGFTSATVGDNLTLQCFNDSDTAKYYWYKQTLGQKPKLISMTYKFDKHGTFHDEFKDNPRFTLETDVGKNHLKISLSPLRLSYLLLRKWLFINV